MMHNLELKNENKILDQIDVLGSNICKKTERFFRSSKCCQKNNMHSKYNDQIIQLFASILSVHQKPISCLTKEQIGTILKFITHMVKRRRIFKISGSMLKGTYVYFMSDIDVLFDVSNCVDLPNSPKGICKYLYDAFYSEDNISYMIWKQSLRFNLDEVILECVPCQFTDGDFLFPDASGEGWKTVRPNEFLYKLYNADRATNHCVTTTIRLMKLFFRPLIDKSLLHGHHLECLVLNAFEQDCFSQNIVQIMINVLRSMADRISYPLEDSSGQNTFVDETLGNVDSIKRRRVESCIAQLINLLTEKKVKELSSLTGKEFLFCLDSKDQRRE
jgi:hypothetical protein